MVHRLAALLLAAVALSACGSPAGPPPPPPTTTVNVVVFYDENGNGLLDITERVRIPNASVTIGTASAVTDTRGRASLLTLAGPQTINVNPSSLPVYFQVAPQSVTLPATVDINIAATLPLGTVLPNNYLAVGDSITRDVQYPQKLQDRLRAYFGAGDIQNAGVDSLRTDEGAAEINGLESQSRPAYTFILLGTNDWTKCKHTVPCFTIDSLQYIVQGAVGAGSHVFLATLPPVNLTIHNTKAPPDRQEWNHDINVYIRQLAQKENVVLVDLEKAFLADPDQGSLFDDHIHPSSKGAGIMVDTFFKAITQRQTGANSRSPFRIGFFIS